MPRFDLPLDQLEKYLPARDEPADFDAFWDATLQGARTHPLAARFEEVDAGLTEIVVEDVTFGGFDGESIKGWMLRPRHRHGPLPLVVTFDGYGGGRGLPTEWTLLPSAGYAHFVMDNRGQGSGHRASDTPDLGSGPHVGGFLTQGVDSPETYFYRRLFTDAVRAVEAARSHPAVDPARTAVAGISQGGGTALAVAALHIRSGGPALRGAIVDVPFLSHVRRATELVATAPYAEIATYLAIQRDRTDRLFETMSYFDGLNFAVRATVPALFSVGLVDDICPPSTVYAAHNHYAGPTRMAVYPYNGHEGGGRHQERRHLQFLAEVLSG